MSRPPSDEVLTIAEAADALQVDVSTVRRWANSGKLRHFRTPGNQRRFRRGDVEALMVPEPLPPWADA